MLVILMIILFRPVGWGILLCSWNGISTTGGESIGGADIVGIALDSNK